MPALTPIKTSPAVTDAHIGTTALMRIVRNLP